jgi:ABC-type nitrate/sulfonate/bicarbonate transport system ATPase subunit
MTKVANLRRTYPTADGGPVAALSDTDLSVSEGEFISIVGPSVRRSVGLRQEHLAATSGWAR